MKLYAILIDFAYRSWDKLPLKWRRVLIGPLELLFFSKTRLRELVSFVTYAKLADGGVWRKVYDRQPTAYKPPIFHGSLRAKVGERNVLSELPEAGVLELKRPSLIPLNLFHRSDYSGRRVRFLPRTVVTAEGYVLNLNCHNAPTPPLKKNLSIRPRANTSRCRRAPR